MKMEISKLFRFEASHSLPLLPKEHKCHRMHGHSYEILVAVEGELDPLLGWVQDYAAISGYVDQLILARLDHQNLNEVLAPLHTTAENLAIWIAQQLQICLPMLSRVEVRETETSKVILRLRDFPR